MLQLVMTNPPSLLKTIGVNFSLSALKMGSSLSRVNLYISTREVSRKASIPATIDTSSSP
jgi:hypothetical protein